MKERLHENQCSNLESSEIITEITTKTMLFKQKLYLKQTYYALNNGLHNNESSGYFQSRVAFYLLFRLYSSCFSTPM